MDIIQNSVELCFGEKCYADDFCAILPYIFVKARVRRLYAHYLFTKAFHVDDDQGSRMQNILANFEMVIESIQSFDIKNGRQLQLIVLKEEVMPEVPKTLSKP